MTTTLKAPAPESDVSTADVKLAILGDSDATRRIVEALQRSVIFTIHRFLGSCFAAEVEDIAQDIFLKVFRSLHRFDSERGVKLATWVYSIARNHCFDVIKKRRIRTWSLDDDTRGERRSLEPCDARGPDPREAALRSELGGEIESAVQELPLTQRFTFILREYEGLDYDAIAEVMNTNIGTVKSRLHRAKLVLRQRLEPYLDAPF